MSNHSIIIVNSCALIAISILLLLAYKLKRKGSSANTNMNSLQQTFAIQDEVIHHNNQALISVVMLLDNLSNKYCQVTKNMSEANQKDIAIAFREVSSRIQEQLNNTPSNNYTMLTGECFNDTYNCLMVLNTIITDCDKYPITEVIQKFKQSLDNPVAREFTL